MLQCVLRLIGWVFVFKFNHKACMHVYGSICACRAHDKRATAYQIESKCVLYGSMQKARARICIKFHWNNFCIYQFTASASMAPDVSSLITIDSLMRLTDKNRYNWNDLNHLPYAAYSDAMVYDEVHEIFWWSNEHVWDL